LPPSAYIQSLTEINIQANHLLEMR